MGKELSRLARRRKAEHELDNIVSHSADALVIHYSCESFYDRSDGKTPRVTSIAVRNYESGQTESFSIHKVAEQRKIPPEDIPNSYDVLEKEMLNAFFEFMRQNQGLYWIHWNMRDINYGFAALEHRFMVLGGIPFVLHESKKFDLARLLVALYGVAYTGHPRLTTLIDKNHIAHRDFMSGKEEADAFESGDYIKLHQSTLRKVDILANILGRTADGTLKTDARWRDRYGVHPRALVELVQQHWLYGVLTIIALLVGLVSAAVVFF